MHLKPLGCCVEIWYGKGARKKDDVICFDCATCWMYIRVFNPGPLVERLRFSVRVGKLLGVAPQPIITIENTYVNILQNIVIMHPRLTANGEVRSFTNWTRGKGLSPSTSQSTNQVHSTVSLCFNGVSCRFWNSFAATNVAWYPLDLLWFGKLLTTSDIDL